MRIHAHIFSAIALCLAPVSAVSSASQGQPIYRMVWNVEPQGAGDARVIRPGDEIVTLKLSPPALFTTSSAVMDAKGKVLIPAGMQLVGLNSQATIACTIQPTNKNGGEALLFLGSLKRVCLIDENKDGRYETRFLRSTNGRAFFLLRGRLSDRQQSIAPTELSRLNPDSIEDGPRLKIRLSETSNPDKALALDADVGNDEEPFDLVLGLRVKTANLPKTFEVYGGSIRIERSSNGDITARVLRPFQAKQLDFWD